MSFLTELAKRAAMKTASKVSQEIPTAAERTVGALVPHQAQALSPLQAAAKVITPEVAPKIAKEGLESPGRRRILKQMASTAARASVPDPIANRLMKMATSPLDEGIARAAAEAGMATPVARDDVVNLFMNYFKDSGQNDNLYDLGSGVFGNKLFHHSLQKFYPEEQLPHLNSALQKLYPWQRELNGITDLDFLDPLGNKEFSKLLKKPDAKKLNNYIYDDVGDNFGSVISHIQSLNLSPEEFKSIQELEKHQHWIPEGLDDAMDHLDPEIDLPKMIPEDWGKFKRWINKLDPEAE